MLALEVEFGYIFFRENTITSFFRSGKKNTYFRSIVPKITLTQFFAHLIYYVNDFDVNLKIIYSN